MTLATSPRECGGIACKSKIDNTTVSRCSPNRQKQQQQQEEEETQHLKEAAAEEQAWKEENAARMKLRRIFSTKTSSQQEQDRAVELLQSFPVLASETYREGREWNPCVEETIYTALMYFIVVGACKMVVMPKKNPQNNNRSSSPQPRPLLDTIQIIYDLYPDAIRVPNQRGRLPIHEACSLSAPEEVIAFLCDRYPQGASVSDNCGLVPFHYALRVGGRKVSAATLRRLLELYPEAFDKKDSTGRWPVRRALMDGCDKDVLQLLFGRLAWTPAIQKSKSYRMVNDGYVRGADLAEGLSVLLPHLEAFQSLEDCNWTLNGMQVLLQHLVSNSSIRNLSLHVPPTYFSDTVVGGDNHEQQQTRCCKSLLAELVQPSNRNCAVTQLALHGRGGAFGSFVDFNPQILLKDTFTFQAIWKGMVANTVPVQPNNRSSRLEQLHLFRFHIGHEELLLLKDILLSPRAPRRVVLDTIFVTGESGAEILDDIDNMCDHCNSQTTYSVVEDLHLTKIPGNWLCQILQRHFMGKSSLKHLTVVSCRKDCEHSSMAQTLLQYVTSSTLESLVVKNMGESFPYLTLTQALAENCQLKKYHITDDTRLLDAGPHAQTNKACVAALLENQNTILQDVIADLEDCNSSSDTTGELDSQIAYYTRLNRYGRVEARNPGTSTSRLMRRLLTAISARTIERDNSNAADATVPSSSSDILHGVIGSALDQHNVVYGLLRETPSIWCGSAESVARSNRKRVRSDEGETAMQGKRGCL